MAVSVAALAPDVLACIALGEAGGPGIWGSVERAHRIQAMVIWVARNQWDDPGRPLDYDVRDQFYAWGEGITEGDIARAQAVLSAPAEDDPTGGCLHVISEQDRIKLGFPKGDITECGVEPYCLHFFKVWPDDASVIEE